MLKPRYLKSCKVSIKFEMVFSNSNFFDSRSIQIFLNSWIFESENIRVVSKDWNTPLKSLNIWNILRMIFRTGNYSSYK